MTVDISRSMATALERAESVLAAGINGLASTFATERGFTWFGATGQDSMKDRSVEVITDHTHSPGKVPAVRLQAVANSSNPPCSGLDNHTFDLIITAIVREFKRKGATHDTKQPTATKRAMYLARAAELVLKTPVTGLIGTEGVYSIKNQGSAHTRPIEGDPSMVAYEMTLRCAQRVHDPF